MAQMKVELVDVGVMCGSCGGSVLLLANELPFPGLYSCIDCGNKVEIKVTTFEGEIESDSEE